MGAKIQKTGLGPGYLFAVALALLAAGTVAIWFRLQEPAPDFDAAKGAERLKKLETLRAEDREKLGKYAVINKEKGTVQLPIKRAMELVEPELKKKPVKPSAVKVEDPYPYGLAPVPDPSSAPAAAPAPAVPPAPAPVPAPEPAAPTPAAEPLPVEGAHQP